MKFYIARHVDKTKTIQFEGKTIVVNVPFLFEYLVKLNNERYKNVVNKNGNKLIDMKDYEIIELEGELHEKK